MSQEEIKNEIEIAKILTGNNGFTKVLDSGETNFWGRDKSL